MKNDSKYFVKEDLCDFLNEYVVYSKEHYGEKLTVEDLKIDEKKFFDWVIKPLGSNSICEQVIYDFDSAFDAYSLKFNFQAIEDMVKSYVSKKSDKLEGYNELIQETDKAANNLRGYDELDNFLETDTGLRYKISEHDSAEDVLFKTAMQKNLYVLQMLSEEIFHVIDNCNAMENDLTFEIFDQFVINRQQKFTKEQVVTYDSEFKEPETKKLQGLYRDFCEAYMLPEIGMLFKNSRSDNQRTFKEYVNNFFNGSAEDNEDENIISIELSEAEVEEIARCEAVNYAVACLFNAKGDLEPSDYVISKEDYQKFSAECYSDLTPESAHELADKYKDMLKIYDEIVVQDKKKTYSR